MLNWLAVAIGGALGAMARYGITVVLGNSANGPWPWATFVANIVGCMLIGVLYVGLVERGNFAEIYRAAFMIGFLGAMTTFSTFSLEVFKLIESNELATALSYGLTSMIMGVLSVWLSITLVRTL